MYPKTPVAQARHVHTRDVSYCAQREHGTILVRVPTSIINNNIPGIWYPSIINIIINRINFGPILQKTLACILMRHYFDTFFVDVLLFVVVPMHRTRYQVHILMCMLLLYSLVYSHEYSCTRLLCVCFGGFVCCSSTVSYTQKKRRDIFHVSVSRNNIRAHPLIRFYNLLC